MGRSLANENMNEEAAAAQYQKFSMENKVTKTKKAAELDKKAMELNSDRESAQTELDAVLQYTKNIRGMCEAKPETYADRKGRREQEISGLQEALRILEGESVFLQRKQHGLRGTLIRAHH